MSEINNNSQYNYNISLDPPNTSAQGTKEGEVEATRKGEVTITDKLTGATMVLSATFDKLGKMTIYMDSENPNLPTPPITSLQINSALKPGDSSGRGNPFLSPIPFVQVTVALLKLHSIMRESNLGMAAFENSIMALSMSLARTEANLIISAAEKEAKMMIMEMVSAGFALVGAAVQFGGALRGLGKFAASKMNKSSKDLDVAKTRAKEPLENLAQAKTDLNVKKENLAKFDVAESDLTNATTARNQKLEQKNQAKADLEALRKESPEGTRSDLQKDNIKKAEQKAIDADVAHFEAEKKVKVSQAKVDDLKTELGLENSAKTGENGPRKQLQDDIKVQEGKVADAELRAKPFKEELDAKQAESNRDQQDFTTESQMETAAFTAFSQILAQSGIIIKSGVNSVLVGQKAQDEADIKMTSAQREILNRTMDSLDKSMQKGGDVMNSLIQALEKLANDHVNASSMTRN